MMRRVLFGKEREYIVSDASDFHSNEGTLSSTSIFQASFGDSLTTNKGVAFTVLPFTFAHQYQRIKRGAAIISPKDAGAILAHTHLGHEDTVLDCGAGSGALTLFLARYVKHVHSVDIREDHLAVVKENIASANLTNVTTHLCDFKSHAPDVTVHAVTLDMPECEKALPQVLSVLAVGGWLVAYVPHTHQLQTLAMTLQSQSCWHIEEILETYERSWVVDALRCRPDHGGLSHSAFLLFARRVKP